MGWPKVVEQRRFVPGVADHQRHVAGELAPCQHVGGIFGNHAAIEGRPPTSAGDARLALENPLGGGVTQPAGAAELGRQCRRRALGILGRHGRNQRAAHGHGTVEAAFGRWHRHQLGDVEAAGRLAENGDIAWVAAERLDLGTHPTQRRHLVQQRFVATRAELRGMEESQCTEPIVHGDHHHVANPRQMLAVDAGLGTGADGIAAAVNPHHHGTLAVVWCWCPDVEVEAILTGLVGSDADELAHGARQGGLNGARAEIQRIAHASPRFGGRRRLPAQVAHGGPSKWNTAEHMDAGCHLAAQASAAGFDDAHGNLLKLICQQFVRPLPTQPRGCAPSSRGEAPRAPPFLRGEAPRAPRAEGSFRGEAPRAPPR